MGERGRSGRQQLHKSRGKQRREFYYFVLIPPLLLSAGHPLAQGGFFGPMRAAAQLLCVIGRLQESKEDT